MTPISHAQFFLTLCVVASFEADATDGLHYMHSVGVVHCDVKLENTLICRSGGPTGFVGKVTDPGLWCGESEFGSKNRLSGRKQSARKVPATSTCLLQVRTAPTVWGQMINTGIQSRTRVTKKRTAGSQVYPGWKAFLVAR